MSTLLVAITLIQGGMSPCMSPPALSEVKSYPTGTIIDGIGSSDIPVTSKSALTKKMVKQGFALRHCFWFNESLRSFRDAVKEDPSCAIAWMGVYMAIENPWYRLYSAKKEGEYAIEKAVMLSGSASELESQLIASYRALSANSDTAPFFKDLESVIKKFPKNNEVKLLLAGHMIQTCLGQYDDDGMPYSEFKRALELSNEVLKSNPKSPGAHHYVIHAVEGSAHPENALKSAEMLGKVAPASAHMVHMPGHIYYRVGEYQKAKQVFQKSTEIGDKYAKEINAPATTDWNYSHNLRFASANLLEMGEIEAAKELAKKSGADDTEIRIRTNDWEGFSLEKAGESFDAPLIVMSYLWQNNMDSAKKSLKKLQEVAETLNVGKDLTLSRVMRTFAKELEARILSAEGKHDEAIALCMQACEIHATLAYDEPPYYPSPPQEALGYIYLNAGKPEKAIEAFNAAFKFKPNSGYVLLGIARAKSKMPNRKQAEAAYEKFLDAWKTADNNAPGIQEAKQFLKKN